MGWREEEEMGREGEMGGEGEGERERQRGNENASSIDIHLKKTICVKALVHVLPLSYSLATLRST